MEWSPWIPLRSFKKPIADDVPRLVVEPTGHWVYAICRQSTGLVGYVGTTSGSITQRGPRPAHTRIRDYAYVVYSAVDELIDGVVVSLWAVQSDVVGEKDPRKAGAKAIEQYIQAYLDPLPHGNERERRNKTGEVLRNGWVTKYGMMAGLRDEAETAFTLLKQQLGKK